MIIIKGSVVLLNIFQNNTSVLVLIEYHTKQLN